MSNDAHLKMAQQMEEAFAGAREPRSRVILPEANQYKLALWVYVAAISAALLFGLIEVAAATWVVAHVWKWVMQ